MSSLVSVIIPTYNRSTLVSQAIESCLAQTWPDVEILVVDDGSEEALEPVVERLRPASGPATLKYFRKTRQGGGAARNFGFRHAIGTFIQYLDSDDLLHPDKLALQVEYLRTRPELDMVFCLDEQFRETPGDIRLLWNVPKRRDCTDDLNRFLSEDAVWCPASPLWRRAALERIGGWSEELICWQDWEFHVAALCAGIRYECLPAVLNYIRHHTGARASWNRGVNEERSCLRAAQLAHDYLERAGLLTDRRRIMLSFFVLRHLMALESMRDPGKAALQRDMLAFMETLAWTSRRRMAVRASRALVGTPLYRTLLELRLFLPEKVRLTPLRNVVAAVFMPEPPESVRRLVVPVPAAQGSATASQGGG